MSGISLIRPFDPTQQPLLGRYNPDPIAPFTTGWEQRVSVVETYSDLEYNILDLTVGGSYNLTENLYTTASVTYSDFNSDEEYVYGDESGESYYGYVGLGYRF